LSPKAQEIDPKTIIESVKSRFNEIKDFTAQAEIIVNVDFIKIPDKYAVVYFKYPDKYRFKSKGFIMVPKRGLNFSISDILSQPATLVKGGEADFNGKECIVVKILPDDPRSEVVLATLLIDPDTHFVMEMEANTRKSGTYSIKLHYIQIKYPLPDEIQIKFDVEKLHFPLKFMGNVKIDDTQNLTPEDATVTIKYSEYKINVGLSDDQFIEKEQEP